MALQSSIFMFIDWIMLSYLSFYNLIVSVSVSKNICLSANGNIHNSINWVWGNGSYYSDNNLTVLFDFYPGAKMDRCYCFHGSRLCHWVSEVLSLWKEILTLLYNDLEMAFAISHCDSHLLFWWLWSCNHVAFNVFLCFNPVQIISLLFPKLSLACDILRNSYEAFALYSFGSYLVACLGKPQISVFC